MASNGSAGRLQLFSARSQALVGSVQIASCVKVQSGLRRAQLPVLTHFAFAAGPGNITVLVTADVQQGEELDAACALKFWEAAAQDGSKDSTRDKNGDKVQQFDLVSQVNAPHGAQLLSSLAVQGHADSVLVCSASADGTLKLWRRSADNSRVAASSTSTRTGWRCAYSLRYRDCAIGSLCLSADLSLLVASYGNLLTFWDPHRAVHALSLVGKTQQSITCVRIVEPRRESSRGG